MLRSRSAPAPDHKNRRQRGKPYTEDTERFCISNCLVIFSLCRGPPKYRLKPYQKKIITGYAVGTLRGLAGVFLVAACTNIHIQYSITVLIIIYIHIYLHTLHYFTPVLLPPINLFRIWKFKKWNEVREFIAMSETVNRCKPCPGLKANACRTRNSRLVH